MATGDIKNNLRKLMVELKQVRYPVTEVDLKGLAQGTPRSFLPIIHYMFLDYSVDLTGFFARDYELYGKTDLRFVETVYKILRDVFHYKPPLTREQFLTIGYAERKIIQLCDILKRCRDKSSQLNPKTSKSEKKHSHIKGKNKEIGVGTCKEDGSQLSQSLEKEGQKHSSRIEISKKKDSGNDTGMKVNEENKENNSVHSLFHSCNSNKPVTCMIDKQTSGHKSVHKSGAKIVRWKEDETTTVNDNSSVPVLKTTTLSEINNSNTQVLNTSAFSNVISTSMRAPPKIIPMPVTMTTIPKPSPELTLTPIGKTKHQPIPLSGSQDDHREDVMNVSLVDLTDSTRVPQAKVVRHAFGEDGGKVTSTSGMPDQNWSSILTQDNELKLLKGIIQELQEKLDAVLSQNNEMSARVVLLENRVKLLEEASNTSRNQCENCINTNYPLPNYNISTNPFYCDVDVHASGVQSGMDSRITTHANLQDHQNVVSQLTASSSRNLINKFTDTGSQNRFPFENNVSSKYMSERYVDQSSHQVEVPQVSTVTEISDDDANDGNHDKETSAVDRSAINAKGSPMSGTPSKSTGTHLEAISPFSNTQEVHLKFSDPSTTATIMNVERRLKETRELLANAARFAVNSLP